MQSFFKSELFISVTTKLLLNSSNRIFVWEFFLLCQPCIHYIPRYNYCIQPLVMANNIAAIMYIHFLFFIYTKKIYNYHHRGQKGDDDGHKRLLLT